MFTKLKKQQSTFFELLLLKYTFFWCSFILFYVEQPKQNVSFYKMQNLFWYSKMFFCVSGYVLYCTNVGTFQFAHISNSLIKYNGNEFNFCFLLQIHCFQKLQVMNAFIQ